MSSLILLLTRWRGLTSLMFANFYGLFDLSRAKFLPGCQSRRARDFRKAVKFYDVSLKSRSVGQLIKGCHQDQSLND